MSEPIPPRDALDKWARVLVRVLDDAIPIPGTKIRVGLDPILGLFAPVVGDLLTGAASLSLLYLAWREGVPLPVMLRMIFNIAGDSLVGSVPIIGDVLDVFWRSNRKNYDLLEEHRKVGGLEPTAADYALLIGLLLLGVGIILVPIIVLGGLVLFAFQRIFLQS